MASSSAQPTFWILSALSAGRRHGYEIMRETAAASDGLVSLKVTTLYAALERLERDRLIHSDGEEVINGRARRYYRIAEAGSARLLDEIELMEKSALLARARLATARPASALSRTVAPA